MTHDDLPLLSDEEIAELDKMSEEPAVEPVATASLILVSEATDEDCNAFIDAAFAEHPGLFIRSAHWSLTLLTLMTKVGYTPPRRLLANTNGTNGTNAPDDIDRMRVVQHHVSTQMLADLATYICDWVAENPKHKKVDTDESVIETEEGGMAYVDCKTEVEKSASESKEGWASW